MSKIYLFLVLIIVGATSCGDFIEEYSQNLSYVNTMDDLEETLLGGGYWVYTKGGAENYLYFLIAMDDDVAMASISHSESTVGYRLRRFFTWQVEPWATDDDNDKMYGTDKCWARFYERIAVCNSVLNDVERFKDDERYSQIKGEALFLRAFYYFYMVNIWGEPYDKNTAGVKLGVPLKTFPQIVDLDFSRNTVGECYQQIVDDVEAAVGYLEGIYPSSTKRVGVQAARALLARVYLYMGEYENVIKYCDEVLDDVRNLAVLDLNTVSVDDYHDILKEEDCPEDIFTATSGLTLRGSSGYRFTVSDDLVECYQEEPGDWRWRGGNEDCHFFAYDLRSGIPIYSRIQIDAATYLFVGYGLSFPEVYLNKAEAEAMLDKAGDAINTINVIRSRRIENPTSIDGLSGEDLVKYIRRERRRELSFLYHRWFDLRRYAVAPKYPEAMTVEHVWEAEESDLANGTYVLNPYPEDGGWVLPFPSHVLEDNHGALVDNVRPARNPIN